MVTVFTFAAGDGDGAAVGFGAAVGDGAAVVGAAAVVLGAAVGDGAGWEQAANIAGSTSARTMVPIRINFTNLVFNLIPSFLYITDSTRTQR